jgi:hypothetical protein
MNRTGLFCTGLLIALVILLNGCGGSSGPVVGNGLNPGDDEGAVSNSSLLDLYKTLSVRYSTQTSGYNEIFYRNIQYSIDGYVTASPQLFVKDPVLLDGYDFSNLTNGSGLVEFRSAPYSLRSTSVFTTVQQGQFAVASLSYGTSATPALSFQLKTPSTVDFLTADEAAGTKSYLSMDLAGAGGIGELAFSQGVVSGGLYSTSATGSVSATPTTVTGIYAINQDGNGVDFDGSIWYANDDGSLFITGQANNGNIPRLAFLVEPHTGDISSGTYQVYQWTVFSPSASATASTVVTSDIPLSEVVQVGSLEFKSQGNVRLTNVLGVTNEMTPGSVAGTTGMRRIPWANINNYSDILFFVSKDGNFLFGMSYDNSVKARVALLIGVKTSS